MKQIVLDASVGGKWYFQEELNKKALTFLERLAKRQLRVHVPTLFYTEMANICFQKVRKKVVSWKEAVQTLDALTILPLERYSDDELSDVAMENAYRYRISIYDSLYLTLAEIYGISFITADYELVKTCRKEFEFVQYLGDI